MNPNIINREHIKSHIVGDKKISVVDEHQYAILFWAEKALEIGKPLTLISIDYHPDTNPPFWMMAYQKAMAKDPEREEELVETISSRMLDRIIPEDITTLEDIMLKMNNDEQINTAMEKGYLCDYHMINCMEKHRYATGHHYLVPEKHFGDLSDEMFKIVGFNDTLYEGPYVLDIDLDYIMKADNLSLEHSRPYFESLVQGASCITMARSDKYFNYLRQDKSYLLDQCEADCVSLLKNILTR